MNATAPILVPTLDELAVEFEMASAIERTASVTHGASPDDAVLELAADEAAGRMVELCSQIAQLRAQNWEHVRLFARALEWHQHPGGDVEPNCPAQLAYTLVRAILDGLPGQATQPTSQDPDAAILADYQAWRAARDTLHHLPPGGTDQDHEPLYQAVLEAEAAVMRHRPSTARGLAIQHVVFTAWGDFEATQSSTFDYQAHVYALADVEPDESSKANPPDQNGGLE